MRADRSTTLVAGWSFGEGQAPGLRHGARIGAEALRDQAADFVELDALADRLQRGQGDDRASHAGGVRVLRVSVIDD